MSGARPANNTFMQNYRIRYQAFQTALQAIIVADPDKDVFYSSVFVADSPAQSIARFFANLMASFEKERTNGVFLKTKSIKDRLDEVKKSLQAIEKHFPQLDISGNTQGEEPKGMLAELFADSMMLASKSVYVKLLKALYEYSADKELAYTVIEEFGKLVNFLKKEPKNVIENLTKPLLKGSIIPDLTVEVLNPVLCDLDQKVVDLRKDIKAHRETLQEKTEETLSTSSQNEAEEPAQPVIEVAAPIGQPADDAGSSAESEESLSQRQSDEEKSDSQNHQEVLATLNLDFARGFKKAKLKREREFEAMAANASDLAAKTNSLEELTSNISFKYKRKNRAPLEIDEPEERVVEDMALDQSADDARSFEGNDDSQLIHESNLEEINKLLAELCLNADQNPDHKESDDENDCSCDEESSAEESKDQLYAVIWRTSVDRFVATQKSEHAHSALWAIDRFLADVVSFISNHSCLTFTYTTEEKKLDSKAKKLNAEIDRYQIGESKKTMEQLDKKVSRFTGCKSILFKESEKKAASMADYNLAYYCALYK